MIDGDNPMSTQMMGVRSDSPQEVETRIALVGIIVENRDATDRLNAILHQYSGVIVGRMGIPYPSRGVAIISVVVDAPADQISSLSGKLGMLDGIHVKTVYSKK